MADKAATAADLLAEGAAFEGFLEELGLD